MARLRSIRTGRAPELVAGITVGAMLVFGFLAGFTIGLPFLMLGLAVLAVGLASKRLRGPALGFSLVLGAGLVIATVGVMHLGDTPCDSDEAREAMRRGLSYECGGFNGVPWLLVGIGVAVFGGVGASRANRSLRTRSANQH
jgi:hypothetical protein